MKIGSVFDQTSTTEFVVMLDQQYDNERLLFSYVELSPDGGVPSETGERIIARITNIHKENPLLSRDQAGVSASVDINGLGFDFSRRFTYGWANCAVIGSLTASGILDMNRRSISPNAQIHTPSDKTLRQLFFNPSPAYMPLGTVESFGSADSKVPVTLNADQMVTKHFCVFGMTGSGKTNTSAKLLEELMARGHRTIVFDTHDDYQNIEEYSNLFRDIDATGKFRDLVPPPSVEKAVDAALASMNIEVPESRSKEENKRKCIAERLIRTASIVYDNTPARQFLYSKEQNRQSSDERISPAYVDTVKEFEPWRQMVAQNQVEHLRCFPELKFYGSGFEDFTINLLAAFQGEMFSSAQWRCLRDIIRQSGSGIQYLQNLYRAIRAYDKAADSTKEVLQQMNNGIQAIYNDAVSTGATPLDLEQFCRRVASKNSGNSQSLFRLSLTDLSSNLRKAMVYAVVTYFFRSYKFGDYRVRNVGAKKANANAVLFLLEEARALIPRSSGDQDIDTSGALARRSMRELAYEGRKFSLGFGLISQKPSTVDPEVVSQSNTFILHQLKSPDDQQYVRSVTESMSQDELEMIKSLGTGRAIVAGVAVRSPVLLNVMFRYSEEGIAEPTPLMDSLSSVAEIRKKLKNEE